MVSLVLSLTNLALFSFLYSETKCRYVFDAIYYKTDFISFLSRDIATSHHSRYKCDHP